MSYTVQRVLLTPFMQRASLLTGKQIVAARPIESVSVIEMPVEDFVKKNEFVLTTAIGCGMNPSLFLSFVRDVYEAGASALAIAVGRHVQEIPEAIIRFAQEKEFPLIELPWEIRFSDIIKEILEQIHQWSPKEQSAIEKTNKDREEFICLLTKGKWTSWEAVEQQAQLFEINVSRPYVCILGYPENVGEVIDLEKVNTMTEESWHIQILRKIESLASLCGKSMKKQVICSFQRERLIIFLEANEEDVQDTVGTFLDTLEQQLSAGGTPIFSWGIGENHAGLHSFHESYKDARIALEIGRNYKGPGHRSTYANTGMFRLLSILAREPSANEMAHTIIGTLASYNRERGLDLLHTLSSYIHHQGNVTQTSRALSLHRQSLLYRLRKIESLTGRSLENPDDLFLLQLCLKLWTMRFDMNIEETALV